jgi:hypothetical protein
MTKKFPSRDREGAVVDFEARSQQSNEHGYVGRHSWRRAGFQAGL